MEQDKIGWRKSSTRLIVLTTDAGFHMAGDGKLAGILEPNDEQCYMDNNVYSRSTSMVGVCTCLEPGEGEVTWSVSETEISDRRTTRLLDNWPGSWRNTTSSPYLL